MIKNIVKITSILLMILVSACETTDHGTKLSTSAKTNKEFNIDKVQQYTHNQFESRDLTTMKSKKKKTQIALFLPLSGKNKELGSQLVNSAVLSLFHNDQNNNIELFLVDSKDTAEEAKKSFEKIISKNIKIVIGPVFGQLTEAVEKDARSNGIALISLSNNHELLERANGNGGIFVSGFMLETQIDTLVNFAMKKAKLNFALIAPNNQYGLTVASILKETVENRDATFIVSELYKPNGSDLEQAVERVVNSFKVSSRLAEGGGNKPKKDTLIRESDKSYPQVIMIPETGKNLSKIISLIKKFNKDERNIQIITTNQIDETYSLNDSNLSGTWFASPDSEKFHQFEKLYYQSYNKFPPRISSIVYDLVAASTRVVDNKKDQTALTIKDFINYKPIPSNGFLGIDGAFRFLPNGLVQRHLSVLQVENGRFLVVEQAAEEFLNY